MWPYYTTLTHDGRITSRLTAEHIAMTLFAVHQQSKPDPMHRKGIGLGTAMRALKQDPNGRSSADALDRRFGAAATASSTAELTQHLRGLVNQLRQASQPIDYSELMRDLIDWQQPDRVAQVRRKWGSQYFAPDRRAGIEDGASDKPAEANVTQPSQAG